MRTRAADICSLGVAELARLYRTGALSPVEVTEKTLDRIRRLNPHLNAFVTVLDDSALTAARVTESQFVAGIDMGPLQGIPVSVKDLIRATGTRTTGASRVLQDAMPDREDASVVRRLRAAGAILVGKTNLDEFGVGLTDLDGPFGRVQNPRKVGYQAGGSSSGSAAAVAAGLSVVSLGTDAGGSIRHPASVCGVAGLKPTHGLVSMAGVISSSSRMDHVGPLARSVADLAAGLAVIAGYDPTDANSVRGTCGDYVGALERNLHHLRLGVPTNPSCHFGHREVLSLRKRALDALMEIGLVPIPLELPRLEEANEVADTLLAVDHFTYHEPGVAAGLPYGAHLLERFAGWRDVSPDHHARARELQQAIRREWNAVFDHVDLLILPANAAGAPRHGEETLDVDGKREPVTKINSRFNRISNLTGFPALMVPVGETLQGLPVGIQLVGPAFGDAQVLAAGYGLERALDDLPAAWGIAVKHEMESTGQNI